MQPALSTSPSSGVPTAAAAKRRDGMAFGSAADMDDKDWAALIGNLLKFFGEEATEEEHAEDQRPGSETGHLDAGAPPGKWPPQQVDEVPAGGHEAVSHFIKQNPIVHDAGNQTAPRTLYISRPLKNGAAVAEWARKAGIKNVLPPGDMHVTLAFSRAPLAWPDKDNRAELVAGSSGARSVERLGEKGDAVVLRFESPDMWKRWDEVRSLGASWDWPEYRPHVTVGYDDGGADLSGIAPFDGPLEFGPEKFAEVDEGWKDKVKARIAGDEGEPRSLYASRRLANAEELLDWAKDVGFGKKDLLDPEDVRVVVAFSDDPLEWPERVDAGLAVPAADAAGNGTRWVAPAEGGAALRFDSPELTKRWWQIREAGASWDMGKSEPFHPQVVFATSAGDLDLSEVEPYDGPLNFAAEEFRPTVDRPDAGRRGDASAGIMFVSPKGKVLFLKRAAFGVHHPGEWDFPGGGLEAGEDAEAAARRESKEEVGADFGLPVRLVGNVDAGDGVDYAAFAMEVPKRFKPTLSDEHVEYLWAHPHDAPAPLHSGLSRALGALVGEGLADREKEEAGDAEPQPHAAGALIVTPAGEALFMLRGGGDHEGEWAFPGGQVDEGEDARDTAAREAGEETGNMSLELSQHPFDRRTVDGKDFATYVALVKDRYPVQMNHEHVDYRWVPLSQPPSPLHPGVEATLRRLAGLEPALCCVDDDPREVGGGDAELPHGKLSESTREEIGSAGSEKREDMPDDVFLEPASKKYPVKERRDGKWAHTEKLLLAAAKRARLNGKPEIAKRADAVRAREFGGAADSALRMIIFDQRSARRYDEDGHLFVESNPISKSNICPYRGSEIPDWESLNLDANRVYMLYRDPKELAAGAASFAGKPLLLRHRPIKADDHPRDLVIGAIGTDVEFKEPYLMAPLSIWDGEAISLIESEEKKELSCGYRYVPVMVPGEVNGEHFDGRMTKIGGNHVTIVTDGRAGPDVVVMDSALDRVSDWVALEEIIFGLL